MIWNSVKTCDNLPYSPLHQTHLWPHISPSRVPHPVPTHLTCLGFAKSQNSLTPRFVDLLALISWVLNQTSHPQKASLTSQNVGSTPSWPTHTPQPRQMQKWTGVDIECVSAQSCLTLCNPTDCSNHLLVYSLPPTPVNSMRARTVCFGSVPCAQTLPSGGPPEVCAE